MRKTMFQLLYCTSNGGMCCFCCTGSLEVVPSSADLLSTKCQRWWLFSCWQLCWQLVDVYYSFDWILAVIMQSIADDLKNLDIIALSLKEKNHQYLNINLLDISICWLFLPVTFPILLLESMGQLLHQLRFQSVHIRYTTNFGKYFSADLRYSGDILLSVSSPTSAHPATCTCIPHPCPWQLLVCGLLLITHHISPQHT